MELVAARKELDHRLYCWALEEWKREIASDFALLRTMNDCGVRVTLKLMEERDRDSQLFLAAALVKRNWRRRLDEWQETYSDEEKKLEQLYLDEFMRARHKTLSDIQRQGRGKRVTPGKVISMIREPLQTVLNSKCKKEGEGWEFETVLGQWTVRTTFSVEAKECYLDYYHNIWGPDNFWILDGGNFASLLGAGGRWWEYEGESDLPLLGESIARACDHFLSAVPKLVEGLEPD